MPAIGCYTLHLYCDLESSAHAWDEFPHEYTGEYGSDCRKRARRAGWKLRDGRAICPKCVQREREMELERKRAKEKLCGIS